MKSLVIRFLILSTYLASVLYIHHRGKMRHSFWRQLRDHSTLLAPYTALISLFSPAKPILDTEDFPELAPLRQNWETIREEARALYEGGHIQTSAKYNDLAFNTFFKKGWKRFYLKWYDDFLPSAEDLCPKTVELVRSIPTVNAALFVALSPKSALGSHRDPFAGSVRYHLGLVTPNSEKCRITIDGTPYVYHDGDDLLFDETFMHNAVNEADTARIILFCDVTRPIQNPAVRAINDFTIRHLLKATATQNLPTEKVGVINQVSSYIHKIKKLSDSAKDKNRKLYYLVKNTLLALLAYQLFLSRFVRQWRQRSA